jgi:MoaA/NifB/PqqE/SkfB family radical SAM enzyme
LNWIDITSQWDAAHSHLRPAPKYLPLNADDFGQCPCCTARTVRVLASTRSGDAWSDSTPIDYCADCDRFFLMKQESDVVTAVDARLWFDQPTFLNIEPTTRCNFNCWYCIGRHMKQEDIDVGNFAKVLDNFPSVKTIALVGEGEPLLHKDFFKMAHMAKDRGIRVMIISNGSAFSKSVIKQICEAEIAYIGISIDSIDAETFARSRLDGDLPKIWEGIKRLRDYRDEHGYRYPRIGVKGTLFTHTKNELPAIVEEAKRNGVEIFESFQALNPMKSYIPIYPKEQLSELASVEPVASAIHRDSAPARDTLQPFSAFCEAEGIEAEKTGKPNVLRKNCDEQWVYSLLSGDVTPCCQIKTPIDPSWNLFNHSLSDILKAPSYENVRFNLWNGLFPTYCDGCWKTR